jgi:hypothetical protein
MAEITLTVQNAAPRTGGVALIFQALDHTTNTYKFDNKNGNVRAIFKGAASATGQMIIPTQTKCNLGQDHDDTSAANALDATTKFVEMGPFDPNFYQDGSGFAFIEKTGTVASVTVALVKG